MKLILRVFLIFCLIVPLVIIPYLAYKEENRYLLLGIILYYGGVLLVVYKQKIFYYIPLFLCIGFWFIYGFSIDQYVTILFFCLTSGMIFFQCIERFRKFIKVGHKEQLDRIEYDNKIQEVKRRIEEYKKNDANKSITPEIIEVIKDEVFFPDVH